MAIISPAIARSETTTQSDEVVARAQPAAIHGGLRHSPSSQ
jgi:hypothetical protein